MPWLSVPGRACGRSMSWPSRLHTRTRSRVINGRRSRAPSSGSTRPIRSPAPTAMIIMGTSAFPAKNRARLRSPCAVPSTPSSTVAPATPCRCSRSQTATNAGTRSDAFLSADVDGQFGGLVQVLGQHDRADLAAQHPGPLQGDQAGLLHCPQLVEHCLDPGRVSTATDTTGRSSDRLSSRSERRWCLSPKPSAPRSRMLVATAVPSEQVQLRVGEEPPVDPVPLAEVGGELETVLGHRCAPDPPAERGERRHRPAG